MSLRVDRLGHLGDGVAEGPVYVARALPGEIVDGLTQDGRISSPRILSPSPNRVTPSCRHYKNCGGCVLMHASDEFVASWKTDIVRRALLAQGIDTTIDSITTSPPRSRRRAVFSARRLKSGPVVGFHARGSATVQAIPGCQLVLPEIRDALPACAEITALLGSRKGEMRFTVTSSEGGIDTVFEGGRELRGQDRVTLAAIAEAHDLARLSLRDDVIVERRPPVHRFGTAHVVPPPGAFLQATREGEHALLSAVRDATSGAARIVDLFSGCGTFSLPLASVAEVHAVEGQEAMIAALDLGWRRAVGLRTVTTEVRDLFRRPLEPDELDRFDAAVIDPPRAGARAQTEKLAAAGIPRIAAVSCNPVTFARDAKTLVTAGFRLLWVRVVDQFRWSPHVELAAAFACDHIRRKH